MAFEGTAQQDPKDQRPQKRSFFREIGDTEFEKLLALYEQARNISDQYYGASRAELSRIDPDRLESTLAECSFLMPSLARLIGFSTYSALAGKTEYDTAYAEAYSIEETRFREQYSHAAPVTYLKQHAVQVSQDHAIHQAEQEGLRRELEYLFRALENISNSIKFLLRPI